MVKHIWAVISRSKDFITIDIWRISLKDLPRMKSFLFNQLRTLLLAVRGFSQDKCLLRASALTFYSLLSIVPVVAMAFGIAKGFGFEKNLEKLIFERLPGQETVLLRVVEFAKALLENTKGGMIAGVGVLLLLWTVIKLLGQIESAFNEIWEIRRSRSPGAKLIYYVFIMVVGPLFVVVASSLTVFVTTQIAAITEKIALLGMFSPFIMGGLKLMPYCLIIGLLSVIYIYMPNTKVNFGPGLIAGVISGITYVVVQGAYIAFQVGIAKNNAIYGSFAALPLFLIWLQISWFIVLFGAETSFAIQNVGTYEFEQECRDVSAKFKRLLTLRIVHLLIERFSKGEDPLTPSEISHELGIPIRLVFQILYELVESNLVSVTTHNDFKEPVYQPARDINQITVKYVIDALDQRGVDDIPVSESRELEALSETLEKFSSALEASPANNLLKDI